MYIDGPYILFPQGCFRSHSCLKCFDSAYLFYVTYSKLLLNDFFGGMILTGNKTL